MTTRRLEDLPEQHATPILALVDAARAAAAPEGDPSAWAAAEAGQAKIRTTYKAPRRTATAGQVAAHALRLLTLAPGDPWPHQAWDEALLQSTEAINSWDWDVRMQGALDLRRTYKDLERPLPPTAVPVQLVGSWLTHAGGPELVPATARLAGYVLGGLQDNSALLAAAWYATHGRRLLAELAPTAPRRRGAPTAEEEQRRAALKEAVRGVAAAHIMTKLDLAAAAGTSRPTVTAWLSEA